MLARRSGLAEPDHAMTLYVQPHLSPAWADGAALGLHNRALESLLATGKWHVCQPSVPGARGLGFSLRLMVAHPRRKR